LLGVLAPVREITFSHIVTAIYVGVTLALLQAAGQVLNQWSDYELDKLARPYRPIPSGMVSRDEALGLAWLLAIFAVGRAFTVTVSFGLYALAILFFSVYYSLAPFSPRKVHPILNVLWLAISRGLIPFLATLTVYGTFDMAVKWGVFGFLWVLAYQSSKDIHDIEADRKFNIKTIPNSYGIKGYRMYMLIVTIIMWIYSALYLPITFFLLPISIIAVIGTNKKVNGLENDASWCSFYLGLGLSYLVLFFS
jgi:4-hydroxybenzoate polyprenyltransferase